MAHEKDAQATAGPWIVRFPDVLACDARQTVICVVTGAVSNESAQADARLIAAAPETARERDELASNLTTAIGTIATLTAERNEFARALALQSRERDGLAEALRELLRLEAIKDDDDVELQIARENARAVLAKVGR